MLPLRVVCDEGPHARFACLAHGKAEDLIDLLHNAELIRGEISELHVVEDCVGVLARFPNFERMLDDPAQPRGPIARDFESIDLVAAHRAHERGETRIGGHRFNRIAVSEYDACIGIGSE